MVKKLAEQKSAKRGIAFVTFAQTRQDARAMAEAFGTHVRCARVVLTDIRDGRTRRLMEHGVPFVVDASGARESAIVEMHRLFEERGYATYIYAKEMPLPRTLTESWVKQQATYGTLRTSFSRDLLVMSHDAPMTEMVDHAWKVLSEAEAGKPKEPSEVDRIKAQQKQSDLLTKKRQSDEVLAAQERELEKNADEKLAKMDEPKK